MPEVEQLSLYSELNGVGGEYYVRNYPARGVRTSERLAVDTITSAGWRLVSTAPTREYRTGRSSSHILNFERPLTRAFAAPGSHELRLHRRSGAVERLRAISPTRVGQFVRASNGPVVKFLGVTRLVQGVPDYGMLGRTTFGEDVRAPLTGVISVNGAPDMTIESAFGDLRCQFLIRDLDGSYRDDVHEAEPLALASHGLMVGVPFGRAALRPEVPFRTSRFEYVVFRGSARLARASELLVRFRFEVAPR